VLTGLRPWTSLLEHYVRTRNTNGQFIAYVDDLIVIIVDNSRKEIEQRGQKIVNEILDWCTLAKLEVSKSIIV